MKLIIFLDDSIVNQKCYRFSWDLGSSSTGGKVIVNVIKKVNSCLLRKFVKEY